MGAVSDDKLLELLDLAMSSNANETVIKARELLGSGIDPRVLTSQMLSLIDPGNSRSIFGGRSRKLLFLSGSFSVLICKLLNFHV